MKNIRLFLTLFITLFTLSCSTEDSENQSADNPVSLTGNIFDRGGNGVANLEVVLNHLGVTDTTDQFGHYSFSYSRDSLIKLGLNVDVERDMLVIKQNGSSIQQYEIRSYTDLIPDTYLVQRNVWGTLLSSQYDYNRIEAVMTKSGDTGSKSADLWLNKSVSEYSGFVYMLQETGNPEFSMYIKVYDSQNRFIGRSDIINFPQSAGDIHIPDFRPTNALPTVKINRVTQAKINTTVAFKAVVADSFNGEIDSVIWNFDDGVRLKGKSVERTFSSERDYIFDVTVYDNDGNSDVDYSSIAIINEDAVIQGLTGGTVTVNDSYTFAVDVFDEHGVAKIVWDFGEGDASRPRFDSTLNSSHSTVVHRYPSSGVVGAGRKNNYPVTLTVIDSLGDSTVKKAIIKVTNDIPTISILSNPPSLIPGREVSLSFDLEDDGDSLTCMYKLNDGNYHDCENGNLKFTVPDIVDANFTVTVKVLDNDGNSSEQSISASVGLWTNRILSSHENKYPYAFSLLKISPTDFVLSAKCYNGSSPVVRFSENSSIIWVDTLDASGETDWYSLREGANEILAIGTSFRTGTKFAYDASFKRVDPDNGATISSLFIGTENKDNPLRLADEKGHSVIITKENHFIIAGSKNGRLWLHKISPDGKMIWENRYRSFEYGNIQIFNVNNDYLVFSKKNDEKEANLTLVSENGEKIWEKSYPGSVISTAIQTKDGGLLLWGAKGTEGKVIKIDENFAVQWSSIIDQSIFKSGANEFNSGEGESVVESSDGSFLLTGFVTQEENRAFIMKLNSLGTSQWVKTLEHPKSGSYTRYGSEGHALSEAEDGSIIVVGKSYFSSDATQVLMLRADSKGNMTPLK